GRIFRRSEVGDAAAAVAAGPSAGADLRPLANRRQKGSAVVDWPAVIDRWIQRDESGQVLVLRAEAVKRPRAERWAEKLENASVHLHERLRVIRLVAVHRIDEAHLVGVLGEIRKQLGDPQSTLAVLCEFPRRAEQLGVGSDAALAERLAV